MQTLFFQTSISNQAKPVHILEEIVWHKLREVEQMKKQLPLLDVQKSLDFSPLPRDFVSTLCRNPHRPSIIAEVKKASPSKGVIRADFNPVAIAQAYERGGAACLSVLTDSQFFQGSFENLSRVRQQVSLPILCKEFIIDSYQIYLAQINGADAVLLIAAILSDQSLHDFLDIIHNLGMEALIEVHTLEELDRVLTLPNVQLIGINNRNLENFTVDLKTTQKLMSQRKERLKNLGITVVSESGLQTATDLNLVASSGADAVLIGESLVKQSNLEQALFNLRSLRKQKNFSKIPKYQK